MRFSVERYSLKLTVGARDWLNIGLGGLLACERDWYEPPRLYLNVLWRHVSLDLPLPYKQPVVLWEEQDEDGPKTGRVIGEYWTFNRPGIVHTGHSLAWMTPAELAARGNRVLRRIQTPEEEEEEEFE